MVKTALKKRKEMTAIRKSTARNIACKYKNSTILLLPWLRLVSMCEKSDFTIFIKKNLPFLYSNVNFSTVSANYPVIQITLKVPGPISQNEDIYSNDASSPKKSFFKFQSNWLNCLEARRDTIAYMYYISLIMVTITSHIFFKTVHFSVPKFIRGNEKNTCMSFLLIPKSRKVWKKKNLTQSDRTSLNMKV